VTPDDVEFVEVPYQEMLSALESNRVEAAHIVEPFMTQAENAGCTVIPDAGFTGGTIDAIYYVSEKFKNSDPELVEAFIRAVEKSQAFAQDNPDAVRRAMLEYTDMSEKDVETVKLPVFSSELSEEGLQNAA